MLWSWWAVYWVTFTRSYTSQVWFHTERKSKRSVNLWNLGRKWTLRLEWLTIYMGKPEILVGWKSNGLRHSVWGASQNMGGDLRRCDFPILFSLFSRYLLGYTSQRVVLPPDQIDRFFNRESRPITGRFPRKSYFPCALIGEKRPSLAFMIFINWGFNLFSSMREWIDIYHRVRAEVFQINFSRGFAKRATSKLNPGGEGRGKVLLYESDGETRRLA